MRLGIADKQLGIVRRPELVACTLCIASSGTPGKLTHLSGMLVVLWVRGAFRAWWF